MGAKSGIIDSMTDLRDIKDPSDLVEVGNFPEPLSAESVRSCLEMGGIEAYVFDGEISNMQGWNVNAFGGVKVMVRRDDGERARAFLAASDLRDREDLIPPGDEISPESVCCLFCHSPRVRTRSWWGLPQNQVKRFYTEFFFKTRVTVCQDCHKSVRS